MSQLLALKMIRTDGGTQPRSTIDPHTVKEYRQDMAHGAEFPPVVVFHNEGDYWLADGFHRHAAAISLKLTEIAADVREGTWRDAVLYSVGANATHGKRRTNEDKRRAVLTLLNDPHWERWSDRQIAKHCGVDGKTVAALRPKPVPASEEVPQIEQPCTVSRGGRTYTMNTAGLKRADKIGTRQAAATKAETLRPTPAQNRDSDDNLVIQMLHLIRNISDVAKEIEPEVLFRKTPDHLRHNLDINLQQAAQFVAGLHAEWHAPDEGGRSQLSLKRVANRIEAWLRCGTEFHQIFGQCPEVIPEILEECGREILIDQVLAVEKIATDLREAIEHPHPLKLPRIADTATERQRS